MTGLLKAPFIEITGEAGFKPVVAGLNEPSTMLKIIIISISLIALSAVALEAHAQTVKKWVDEEGVTHYSDQGPAEKGDNG